MASSKHFLPSKIPSYLRRLELEYRRAGRNDLSEAISSSSIWIEEESLYDNWNGGTIGHDVVLFLPPDVIAKISLDAQAAICDRLREDFRKCSEAIANEFVRLVAIEISDEDDFRFLASTPFQQRQQINPDTLTMWRPGFLRVFISHRDTHKAAARKLADALEPFGISAFVAHDTIEPLSTWQHEIMRGLDTMEIMIAFVTDDFHESTWTNQEVGYALGKNVPIIPLKLERKDPSGFIASIQAQKGRLDNPVHAVSDVYRILAEKLGQRDRLQRSLISAFASSPDFSETKSRFDRLSEMANKLSDSELAEIIKAFGENDQLHNAMYLTSRYNRLLMFLARCTGKEFEIQGRRILEVSKGSRKDMPF